MSDELQIISLQEKLMHQQQDIERLGQEVFMQQKEIQKLNRLIVHLHEKIETISEIGSAPSAMQKPPHY